jgi:hypothetical protein
MAHSRFFAAVLSFSTSGAMLAGAVLADESQAMAAARSPVKATAVRMPRAQRSNEPASGARRMNDATRESAPAQRKEASGREREGSPEKSTALRGAERAGAKRTPETSSNTKSPPVDTRLIAPPESGKAVLDIASGRNIDVTVNRSPEGTSGRSADGASARAGDARGNAAKPPNENTVPKAPPEKLGNDAAGDAPDPSRAGPDSTSPSARRELASAFGAASPARPVAVVLEGPVFDGGDVPRAAAALDRMKTAFGKCASVENAFTKNEASIDLRFLVRAPGRAEGVDVDKARGVSSDVVRCMTSVLARSYIGAPSDDPVGVAVTVRVKKD